MAPRKHWGHTVLSHHSVFLCVCQAYSLPHLLHNFYSPTSLLIQMVVIVGVRGFTPERKPRLREHRFAELWRRHKKREPKLPMRYSTSRHSMKSNVSCSCASS